MLEKNMAKSTGRRLLTPLDELLTTKEIAGAFGVSTKTIGVWRNKGLPHVKYPGLRGAVRFRLASVAEWVTTLERGG
jgi:phage terminase Nu1 subunit (DNA packaging protein)